MEITRYIPHREHMVLIDQIDKNFEDDFTTIVNINSDSLLCTEKGVPSYCGIEYMAQSIAAYSSIYLYSGQKARIGFIISLRNYQATKPFFDIGSKLIVKVTAVLVTHNSRLFDCFIYDANNEIVSAKIMAFVPNESDLEKLSNGKNNER